jgi:hypothetical protein
VWSHIRGGLNAGLQTLRQAFKVHVQLLPEHVGAVGKRVCVGTGAGGRKRHEVAIVNPHSEELAANVGE